MPRIRRGTVAGFDPIVGLGTIRGEDGEDYPFHCTQIADATRDIPLGVEVQFELVAGQLGRWEAADIAAC